MFGLIKKNIYGIVHASNHTKCVSLSNQTCMTLPTVINLHLNEYSQDFHYYSFVVKLDRFVGSCNTLNDLSNKVCISNKAEDLKVSMFYMIKGINKSKIYHANIKVNLMEKNIIQINGGIMRNVDVSVKNIMYVKKIIFGILLHAVVKIENI